jgi:hypothetical protein
VFQIVSQGDRIDGFLRLEEESMNERIRNEQEYETLCKAEQFILTQSGLAGFKNQEEKNKLKVQREAEIEEINARRREKEKVRN